MLVPQTIRRQSQRCLAILMTTLLIACSTTTPATSIPETSIPATPIPATPLQLAQLPYDISTLPATWTTLDLNGWPANRYQPIHIFGTEYDGKIEPTLMFDFLPVGGEVRAPFDGRVLEVRDQAESCDSEMYLLPTNEDPNYPSVSLDHVIPLDNLRTKGATFKAGDVIATLGKWECKKDFARFELMVLAQTAQGLQSECPLRLLSQPIASTTDTQIKEIMQSWNALNPPSPYPPDVLQNGICALPYTQP